jgi:hypothetical protein
MLFKDAKGAFSDGYKTLVFQEAVKHGLLFRGTFTPSLSHTDAELERTAEAFRKIFKVYAQAIEAGDYRKFLVGDPVKPVFRKFN